MPSILGAGLEGTGTLSCAPLLDVRDSFLEWATGRGRRRVRGRSEEAVTWLVLCAWTCPDGVGGSSWGTWGAGMAAPERTVEVKGKGWGPRRHTVSTRLPDRPRHGQRRTDSLTPPQRPSLFTGNMLCRSV
jgi:hypothetical protein